MLVRHFYGRPGLIHRGPGLFAWLFFAVLVALLIVAVIRLVEGNRRHRYRRWAGPQGAARPRSSATDAADPALRELRVRYARGEVPREEYLERARDLGAWDPPPPGPPDPSLSG
jgi:uncharacterized membrane protein